MVFNQKVFYLGVTEKEFNNEKYKVLGFIDLDTMKAYTCSIDKNSLDEFLTLPVKQDYNLIFKLDKRIAGSKEVLSLKVLGVFEDD